MRLVAHPAICHFFWCFESVCLKFAGKVLRNSYFADQTAFSDHRVGHSFGAALPLRFERFDLSVFVMAHVRLEAES